MNRKALRVATIGLMIGTVAVVGWRLMHDWAPPARSAPDGLRWQPPREDLPTPSLGAPVDPADAHLHVRGTVRNVRGELVATAVVALLDDDRSAPDRAALAEKARLCFTNGEGRFSLQWPHAEAGSGCVLSVRHQDYGAHAQQLASPPAQPLDIVLEEALELAGTVVLMDGRTAATGVRLVARGVAAPYAASGANSLPPARAAFQETVTDGSGSFVFRGLPAGWYQLDAIAPGLAVVPDTTMMLGSEVALAGARGTVARAGGGGVQVRVAAVASVAVRATEATSGRALPHANVFFSVPDGLELVVRSPASMNAEIMLVNGRAYSAHEADLTEGVQARLVLSRSYPIEPGTRCKTKVMCAGYEAVETNAEVVPLGTTEGLPVQEVLMRPLEETGGARFVLHDRKGVPVQAAMSLVLENTDRQETLVVPIRFGADGRSDTIALPIGPYEVRAAAKPERTPVVPAEAVIVKDQVREVPLALGNVGGFALTVQDRSGMRVDDFGVCTELGHQPIEATAGVEANAYVIRGVPVLVPGLGGAWRGQTVGYREGPVTIEVTRHGYRPIRIFAEATAGEITPVLVVLEEDPGISWGGR